MLHLAKIFVVLCVACCVQSVFAKGELMVNVGKSVAEVEGVDIREESRTEGGSFWRVGNDFQIFLAPDLPRGELQYQDILEPEEVKAGKPKRTAIIGLGLPYVTKLAQIKSIRYTVRVPTPPAPAGAAASVVPVSNVPNVHLALRIYTQKDSDPTLGPNDGPFFQRRLISEPMYMHEYAAQVPLGRWSTVQTDHAVSPLLFYDMGRTPPGFFSAPTLVQLQRGGYDRSWRDFLPAARGEPPVDSYAYGDSVVKYISLMTFHNEGLWKNFKGDLDTLRLELITGEVVLVDFGSEEGTRAPAGTGSLIAWGAIVGVCVIGLIVWCEKKRRKGEAARTVEM